MYKAILFHPEGDYVIDFKSETIQDVWDRVCDMGSRWIFYPISFVSTDKVIVDTPEGLEFLKRKHIKTVAKFLNDEWEKRADEICDMLNDGYPLNIIY